MSFDWTFGISAIADNPQQKQGQAQPETTSNDVHSSRQRFGSIMRSSMLQVLAIKYRDKNQDFARPTVEPDEVLQPPGS